MTITQSNLNAASFFGIPKELSKYDVVGTLKAVGIKHHIKAGMDIWMSCPHPQHEESKPSCHICGDIYSKLYGIWHCFGCKRSGTIKDIVSYHDGIYVANSPAEIAKNQRSELKKISVKTPKLPKEFKRPTKEHKWDKKALKYLYGRDITWEQILLHGIGYCSEGRYKNRIIIPVMLNGEIRTWVARTVVDSYLRVTSCRGGKPGLFGSEIASPKLGPAIVCEGWASALAVERLGYANVMSLQTNGIHHEQMEFLMTFPYIIVVPDGDGGGDALKESIELYARNKRFFIVTLPRKYDPADMNPLILKNLICNAKRWEPEGSRREVEFAY